MIAENSERFQQRNLSKQSAAMRAKRQMQLFHTLKNQFLRTKLTGRKLYRSLKLSANRKLKRKI